MAPIPRLLAALLLAVVAVPAAAQEPAPIVIGQSWRLASTTLGAERTINVWVPPSYAEGERRYSVLYIVDGGLQQDFHHISGLAQLGSISTLIADMIVVGIETVDRRRELTFAPERDARRLLRQFPTAGHAATFRRHLLDEVKPFIEGRYRTSGDDAIIGESLAGLCIVDTFLREPAAFDTYIAISPSLWWDNGGLPLRAPALLAAHDDAPRRLWLGIADEGGQMQAGMDRLVAALRDRPSRTLTWRYEPRPDLTHGSIYHGNAFEALQALYPRPEE